MEFRKTGSQIRTNEMKMTANSSIFSQLNARMEAGFVKSGEKSIEDTKKQVFFSTLQN